ncbi:MAG: DNA-processing protein DprA [Ignavibacteria bacterium]
MDNFKNLYYLSQADGLGSVRIKKLLDIFGEPQNILKASRNELSSIEGISKITADTIVSLKNEMVRLDKEFAFLEKKMERLCIGAVTCLDKDYPDLLKKIYDPPVILYFKGNMKDFSFDGLLDNSIGIVGTRTPSEYGKRSTEYFASELSSMGITIISGFARGIDTIAHKAVLKKNEGKTAAVFGCGVDVIYPPENKKVYERIIEDGLVVSEFDVSAKPDSMNFPRRNRIISGLSLGVIIIESGIEGGALITARCALDQSREVFAVPGDINSKYSKGTNNLIKTGQAKLVENPEDILVELRSKLKNLKLMKPDEKESLKSRSAELKGNEKLIFDTLSGVNDPMHIDELSETTGLNISDCLVILLNLEFKGYIRQLPGKRFNIV